MVASPNDTVRAEIADSVCTITVDRPDALNAITSEVATALLAITETLVDEPAVRTVVLTGAGDHFIAGGDVKGFKQRLDAEPDKEVIRDEFAALLEIVHGVVLNLRRMPQPVIASVRGACAGAGLSLTLACDLTLAAEDAVFTLAYSHLGTTPDGGSTWLLPRLVGLKRASEIALLGDRFGAAEAERWGLINRVVAADRLDAETRDLARRLAAGPPNAYAGTKRLLDDGLTRDLADQLRNEAQSFADAATTEDFHEGVTAFTEKRAPRFKGG